MFCKTKTKPKVSEKRGNLSEFHSERNYLLQNWYFTYSILIPLLFNFSEDLMQVRLNSYRAFHPIMDLSTQQKYYNFFPNLIEMSKEEKYCKTFSMTPDVVLIVNNWRLLHGRQSYILRVNQVI